MNDVRGFSKSREWVCRWEIRIPGGKTVGGLGFGIFAAISRNQFIFFGNYVLPPGSRDRRGRLSSTLVSNVRLLFSRRRRPGPARETVTSCGGILIRLPSSIASGFGGLYRIFRFLVEMAISKLRAGPALARTRPDEINDTWCMHCMYNM